MNKDDKYKRMKFYIRRNVIKDKSIDKLLFNPVTLMDIFREFPIVKKEKKLYNIHVDSDLSVKQGIVRFKRS